MLSDCEQSMHHVASAVAVTQGGGGDMQSMMSSMMSNPMMASMMNNPEALRSMLQSNPTVRQVSHLLCRHWVCRHSTRIYYSNPGCGLTPIHHSNFALLDLKYPETFSESRSMMFDFTCSGLQALPGQWVGTGHALSRYSHLSRPF